jgi:hypothetical protein
MAERALLVEDTPPVGDHSSTGRRRRLSRNRLHAGEQDDGGDRSENRNCHQGLALGREVRLP